MADNTAHTGHDTTPAGMIPAQEEAAGEDWKIQARKWEERAKANMAEVRRMKTELDAAQSQKTDLEKALDRIAKLESNNARLEHEKLLSQVAASKKVDPGLLKGDTLEELEASAEALLAWRGDRPIVAHVPQAGAQPSQPKQDEKREFLKQLLGKEE
ncbi:hypothetical protein [Trueperella sp. LYQ143]|uniref:hypothetical protein n=1 Tax=Trueperella sp. LYQ143 TaxID=3391059 RepID=UPI0039839E38